MPAIRLMRTYARKRFKTQPVEPMKRYVRRKRFHEQSIPNCTLEIENQPSHGLLLFPVPSCSEMSTNTEDQTSEVVGLNLQLPDLNQTPSSMCDDDDGQETVAYDEFTHIANANGRIIIFGLNKDQTSEISSISSAAAIASTAPVELEKNVGRRGEALCEGSHDHHANVANTAPAKLTKNVCGRGETMLEEIHDHGATDSGLFFNFINGDLTSSDLLTVVPPSTPISSAKATSSPGLILSLGLLPSTAFLD